MGLRGAGAERHNLVSAQAEFVFRVDHADTHPAVEWRDDGWDGSPPSLEHAGGRYRRLRREVIANAKGTHLRVVYELDALGADAASAGGVERGEQPVQGA